MAMPRRPIKPNYDGDDADDDDKVVAAKDPDGIEPEDEDDDGDGESDDEPDVEAAAEKPERTPRQKARADRGRFFRENKELREALNQQAQRTAYLEGLARNLQVPQPEPQRGPDPILAKLDANAQAQDQLREAYAALQQSGRLTPETDRQYAMRARELAREEAALVGFQVQRHTQRPQMDASEVAFRAVQQQVVMENQDVYSHPQAHQWSVARYMELKAQGRPDSREMHDECMEYARHKMGMPLKRARPAPTPGQRSKYMGPPSSAQREAGERVEVKKTKAHVQMANARFSHIKDPKKRWEAFEKMMQRD